MIYSTNLTWAQKEYSTTQSAFPAFAVTQMEYVD